MSRDIKLVTLALFLWGSGEGLFVYILPLYMEQLGATPQEVGAVLGLAAFLAACSFIPGGMLADRFDAKKIMVWGWAIGAVASLGMGLAPDVASVHPVDLDLQRLGLLHSRPSTPTSRKPAATFRWSTPSR